MDICKLQSGFLCFLGSSGFFLAMWSVSPSCFIMYIDNSQHFPSVFLFCFLLLFWGWYAHFFFTKTWICRLWIPSPPLFVQSLDILTFCVLAYNSSNRWIWHPWPCCKWTDGLTKLVKVCSFPPGILPNLFDFLLDVAKEIIVHEVKFGQWLTGHQEHQDISWWSCGQTGRLSDCRQ